MHASEVSGVAAQSSLDKANALIAQGSTLLEKGETRTAHSALVTALDILASGSETHPEDGQGQLARFNAYDRLADVAAKSHDAATEIKALTNCLTLAENQARAEHAALEGQQRLSVTHQKLGDALAGQGKADEAERHYLKAIATWRELSKSSQLPSARRALAVALAELGNLKLSQSDTEARPTRRIFQFLSSSQRRIPQARICSATCPLAINR